MLYKPSAIIFPCLGRSTTTSRSFKSTLRRPVSASYGLERRANSYGLSKTLPDGTAAPPASRKGPYEERDSTERIYGGGKHRREEWESESDELSSLGKERVSMRELIPGRREKGGKGMIMRQVDVDVDVTYQDPMGRVQASDQRVQDAREAV